MWIMKSNTNTTEKVLKRKRTKGPAPPPAGEKISGLNPALPFIKSAKDSDADEETISIKICIGDNIYREKKANYETKSFKVIETFG